ncbi:MAG TPA: phosphomannomutase/phosphoglucomutase [Acidimicrobiia bacterium]|nr:phosphomannomutase/phosphoglucomutase [Acidimicrobiia bacterium]
MEPDKVFKAYDVRGRVDTGELDVELYRRIGRAVVSELGADRVAIGRDCRASSPELASALADGVLSVGADVIDLGEVPTDAVYYYSGAHQVHGAVVTASHNPAEYNGLKLCRPGAAPVGEDSGLADIKASVVANDARPTGPAGTMSSVDIVDDYVEHLFSIVPATSIRPLRVAVDGGNGMAGIAIVQVFDRIPATLDGLYLEPDGSFPNHPADPLVPENLEDLRRLVSEGEFDLGVAFDGDADRAFFLDDHAEPLSGSTVTSLVARRILADNPGGSVVHNLITSKAVPEIVSEAGGVPIRTRVGHSYIKQVMAESGAVFGGEHSGHYYFRDNFRADSGMLAMLFLLRVVSEDGRALSEIRTEVERYAASGEINFTVADAATTMATVAAGFPDAEVDTLDGMTVDLGESWFNMRPSNTEPLLRLNAEAPTSDDVAELVERVKRIMETED